MAGTAAAGYGVYAESTSGRAVQAIGGGDVAVYGRVSATSGSGGIRQARGHWQLRLPWRLLAGRVRPQRQRQRGVPRRQGGVYGYSANTYGIEAKSRQSGRAPRRGQARGDPRGGGGTSGTVRPECGGGPPSRTASACTASPTTSGATGSTASERARLRRLLRGQCHRHRDHQQLRQHDDTRPSPGARGQDPESRGSRVAWPQDDLRRHGDPMSGTAWVELPEWFEALNGSVRYQLSPRLAPPRQAARRREAACQPLPDRRRSPGHGGLLAAHGHPARPLRHCTPDGRRGGQARERARLLHQPRRVGSARGTRRRVGAASRPPAVGQGAARASPRSSAPRSETSERRERRSGLRPSRRFPAAPREARCSRAAATAGSTGPRLTSLAWRGEQAWHARWAGRCVFRPVACCTEQP